MLVVFLEKHWNYPPPKKKAPPRLLSGNFQVLHDRHLWVVDIKQLKGNARMILS